MVDTSVKELAAKLKIEPEVVLAQIEAAELPSRDANAALTMNEIKVISPLLRSSMNDAPDSVTKARIAPTRIALRRTKTDTVQRGRGGRKVTVQRKGSRIYRKTTTPVQRPTAVPEPVAEHASGLRMETESNRADSEKRKVARAEIAQRDAQRREAAEAAKAEADRELAAKQAAQEQAQNRAKEQAELRIRMEASAAQDLKPGGRGRGGAKAKPKRSDRRGSDRDTEGDIVQFRPKKRAPVGMRRRRRLARPEDLDTGGEFQQPVEFVQREIELSGPLSVSQLAQKLSLKVSELIKKLITLGEMKTINDILDVDTATLLIEEVGHKVKIVSDTQLEDALEEHLKIEGESTRRSPVVTVMGHVDHGKTSLLDYIRKTRVAAGEAGGITQHIGAYHINTPHGNITFLDTPGHAAFSAMRARGANSTDIVVLVCAANDGVMPQTEEAVNHSQAAEVPIIVAVNKMDLDGADPDRVRNELSALGLAPEEWGGETQYVNVSAETGDGIEALLEAISLQAEILELEAVTGAPGRGVVIESELDKGRGPVASLLVQNGTLKHGDVVVAGEYFGKVRSLIDDQNQKVKNASPSMPVEMLGLNGVPAAGDTFSVAQDDRQARQLVESRARESQQSRHAQNQIFGLEDFLNAANAGEKRVLKIVLKADVRGSLEAISEACGKIGNEEVSVQILGAGVGGINESDINLAVTYGAVVFGFNVRTDKSAKALVERHQIDVRYYNVIYELLDDITQVLEGMLVPEKREEIVGTAEVRDVFNSPRFGQIAGCMVIEGTVFRNKKIRVLRDATVIYEGELESLRRFKDDVAEVRNGFECGIGVRNYTDVRLGDMIEVFETREVARAL